MAKKLGVKEAMKHFVSTNQGAGEPGNTIKKLTKQALDPTGQIEGVQNARTIADIWEALAIAHGYEPDDEGDESAIQTLFTTNLLFEEQNGYNNPTWVEYEYRKEETWNKSVALDSENAALLKNLIDNRTEFNVQIGDGDPFGIVYTAIPTGDYIPRVNDEHYGEPGYGLYGFDVETVGSDYNVYFSIYDEKIFGKGDHTLPVTVTLPN